MDGHGLGGRWVDTTVTLPNHKNHCSYLIVKSVLKKSLPFKSYCKKSEWLFLIKMAIFCVTKVCVFWIFGYVLWSFFLCVMTVIPMKKLNFFLRNTYFYLEYFWADRLNNLKKFFRLAIFLSKNDFWLWEPWEPGKNNFLKNFISFRLSYVLTSIFIIKSSFPC